VSGSANPLWPVLTRYQNASLRRIALPLGGIGTGTISLGGRGDLRDWEVVNRPAKGFVPDNAFFVLRTRESGKAPVMRCLEGVVAPEDYEGWSGSPVPNHGLPRFRSCEFVAAYPLAQVLLSDDDIPVAVRLEAFNPLIPADSDSSGLPVVALRFVLKNLTDHEVDTTVCGSLQNFIGTDGVLGVPESNTNIFRGGKAARLRGILMASEGVGETDEKYGSFALTTTALEGVSYRTRWGAYSWSNALLDFWDDLLEDGQLTDAQESRENVFLPGYRSPAPTASLAVSSSLPPHGEVAVTFLLAWHFPNRLSWRAPSHNPETSGPLRHIGNYYATQFGDAWAAATEVAKRLEELEARTVTFVRSVVESTLPEQVKEAALYNLSTLRSQTCFRTEDGNFYGWEGCQDHFGSCFGSCTHVWNYEQATAFLFGDLARGMREVEFLHTTDERGLMSFRVNLPLEEGNAFQLAAADGQMGCVMKLYRDWQLSGDNAFLRRLWPKAQKALEFCWIPGGWDADQDGVMEGCQHNTMDVEYYGPNPQMEFWYLGALRAAEEMSHYLGETAFAERCSDLFRKGSAWTDENLFNGEYYEHHVYPPGTADAVANGLISDMGSKDFKHPELQLGTGCLVDQLVGQYMAHLLGLGYLANPDNIKTTLESIKKYNFKSHLYDHFNNSRTYALNDESALLMATYPRGERPKLPFPYFNEVMTGFEYAAAVGMLYERQIGNGLEVIQAIRDRYDGRRRNPFNEAECGHHYARAMASWGAIIALTGFRYSGVEKKLWLNQAQAPAEHVWSNGYAWGVVAQEARGEETAVTLRVVEGSLEVAELILAGWGSCHDRKVLGAGDSHTFIVRTPLAEGVGG